MVGMLRRFCSKSKENSSRLQTSLPPYLLLSLSLGRSLGVYTDRTPIYSVLHSHGRVWEIRARKIRSSRAPGSPKKIQNYEVRCRDGGPLASAIPRTRAVPYSFFFPRRIRIRCRQEIQKYCISQPRKESGVPKINLHLSGSKLQVNFSTSVRLDVIAFINFFRGSRISTIPQTAKFRFAPTLCKYYLC